MATPPKKEAPRWVSLLVGLISFVGAFLLVRYLMG